MRMTRIAADHVYLMDCWWNSTCRSHVNIVSHLAERVLPQALLRIRPSTAFTGKSSALPIEEEPGLTHAYVQIWTNARSLGYSFLDRRDHR